LCELIYFQLPSVIILQLLQVRLVPESELWDLIVMAVLFEGRYLFVSSS